MIVKAVAHHGKQLIAVGSMRDVDLAARWSMPTSAEVFLGNPEKLRSIDFCRWNINNNQIIVLLTNQGQVSAQCMYHGLAHSEGRKMACLSSNAGKKENQKPFRTSSHPWGFGKQIFFWAVKWWQQSRKSCWVWVSLSRLLSSNLPEVDNFPFPFSLFFLLFIFFFWDSSGLLIVPDTHSFGGTETRWYRLDDSLRWIEYGKQVKLTAPLKPSSKPQPLVEKSCFECLGFCEDCLSGGTQAFSVFL